MHRWLTLCMVLMACEGATRDPGLEAYLRVDSAQFRAGRMPEPNGGPQLVAARVPHNSFAIGSARESVSGATDPAATAVAIARSRDAGYWIVRTGVPTAEEPDYPSFRAQLELARNFPQGAFELQLSAVDRAGHFGPRTTLELSAVAVVTEAELVIALRWDNSADLDLHVRDPLGIDIWSGNINSSESAGSAQAGSGGFLNGGILDFDSNASCSRDGRDAELVTWRQAPPSGEYSVRVATAALCGQPAAHWQVSATLAGMQLMAASGISLPSDTRAGSSAQSGVLAFTFVVP